MRVGGGLPGVARAAVDGDGACDGVSGPAGAGGGGGAKGLAERVQEGGLEGVVRLGDADVKGDAL